MYVVIWYEHLYLFWGLKGPILSRKIRTSQKVIFMGFFIGQENVWFNDSDYTNRLFWFNLEGTLFVSGHKFISTNRTIRLQRVHSSPVQIFLFFKLIFHVYF